MMFFINRGYKSYELTMGVFERAKESDVWYIAVRDEEPLGYFEMEHDAEVLDAVVKGFSIAEREIDNERALFGTGIRNC